MKKKTLLILLIITVVAMGAIFWMKNFNISGEILKTSVKERDLADKPYILCKDALVTGFDWIVIQDTSGKKTWELCNITGPNPDEFQLSADFFMAQNTYVFYVEERKEYYSEEIRQDCVEYIVSGWEILYPVKHDDLFGFIMQNKYITTDDQGMPR